MSYVQGFVIPVPKQNRDAYRALSEKTAPLFHEYGATRIVECWGEDLPKGKQTDFNRAVKARADEAVIFAWMEWPDKATCDAAETRMQSDPRFDEAGEMPFDGARMIWAGFEPIFESNKWAFSPQGAG